MDHGEIIKHGVTGGASITIIRGCANTVAASHPAGSTVYRLCRTAMGSTPSPEPVSFSMASSAGGNGDNGLNIRCNKASLINCQTYGNCGPGIGINTNTSQTSSDIFSTLDGAITASATSVLLVNAASFPTSGYARVDLRRVHVERQKRKHPDRRDARRKRDNCYCSQQRARSCPLTL